MLYTNLANQMSNMDGMVYLESTPSQAYVRAKGRNTTADRLLDLEYLQAIHDRYQNLLYDQTSFPVLKVSPHLNKHEAAVLVASWIKSFLD